MLPRHTLQLLEMTWTCPDNICYCQFHCWRAKRLYPFIVIHVSFEHNSFDKLPAKVNTVGPSSNAPPLAPASWRCVRSRGHPDNGKTTRMILQDSN